MSLKATVTIVYWLIAVVVAAVVALRWLPGVTWMAQYYASFGWLTVALMFVAVLCIFGVAFGMAVNVINTAYRR